MRLFDTHAHYDSGAFRADRLEVLASMPGRGVELILNPGCELESSKAAVELAERAAHAVAESRRFRQPDDHAARSSSARIRSIRSSAMRW